MGRRSTPLRWLAWLGLLLPTLTQPRIGAAEARAAARSGDVWDFVAPE